MIQTVHHDEEIAVMPVLQVIVTSFLLIVRHHHMSVQHDQQNRNQQTISLLPDLRQPFCERKSNTKLTFRHLYSLDDEFMGSASD